MGISSWLKTIFSSKKDQFNDKIEPIPILRTETSEKIIETKIQPVRIPTIVDIGERLAFISHDLNHLKNEIVSKSWFKFEYIDKNTEIIEKLSIIENKLNSLINTLSDFNSIIRSDINKITSPYKELTIHQRIFNIIKERNKIRYKDIRNSTNITDPTLSKYLKITGDKNEIYVGREIKEKTS